MNARIFKIKRSPITKPALRRAHRQTAGESLLDPRLGPLRATLAALLIRSIPVTARSSDGAPSNWDAANEDFTLPAGDENPVLRIRRAPTPPRVPSNTKGPLSGALRRTKGTCTATWWVNTTSLPRQWPVTACGSASCRLRSVIPPPPDPPTWQSPWSPGDDDHSQR